jgi:hypothetical protein
MMRMSPLLSDKQTDLLRYLDRQTGPVLVDHLDGRVLRALKSREMIAVRNGWATLTDAGRRQLEAPARRRRRRGAMLPDSASRSARAEAIQRAVDLLEKALPRDAEMAVGTMFTAADDVVEGFRRYARALAKQARQGG